MNDQQRAAMIRPRGKSVFPQMVAAYKAMQMALEALEVSTDWDVGARGKQLQSMKAITALREALAQPQGEWFDLASAWAEGYESGINDERESEACIGIAGFGAKISPNRQNPYTKNTSPVVPQGEPVAWMRESEDCTDCFVWERDEEHTIPLYTTPPSVEAAIEATKEKVYQAIRDAETPATQLTLGQQEMIKAAIRSMK